MVEQSTTITPTKPTREPVMKQLLAALGLDPNLTMRTISAEADERVARGIAPGRVTMGANVAPRIVNYSSALEAGFDFHRWALEREYQDAVTRREVARDDVAGNFGDEAMLGRAQAVVDGLRDRLHLVERLWPVVEYAALSTERFKTWVGSLEFEPDPEPVRHAPISVETPRGTSLHPFRAEVEAHDIARKAALRMALRENAFAASEVTPYRMARAALHALDSKIARWHEAHPMLGAMLRADSEHGDYVIQW